MRPMNFTSGLMLLTSLPLSRGVMNALQRQTAGSSKGKGIEAIMIFIPVTTAGPMAMYYRRFSAVYWAASSRTLVWRDKELAASEVSITQPTERETGGGRGEKGSMMLHRDVSTSLTPTAVGKTHGGVPVGKARILPETGKPRQSPRPSKCRKLVSCPTNCVG